MKFHTIKKKIEVTVVELITLQNRIMPKYHLYDRIKVSACTYVFNLEKYQTKRESKT